LTHLLFARWLPVFQTVKTNFVTERDIYIYIYIPSRLQHFQDNTTKSATFFGTTRDVILSSVMFDVYSVNAIEGNTNISVRGSDVMRAGVQRIIPAVLHLQAASDVPPVFTNKINTKLKIQATQFLLSARARS
jgi:hypothetical protein